MVATKKPSGSSTDWNWTNHEHIMTYHHDIAGGEAADVMAVLRAGVLEGDIHVDRVAVSLENAPGGGKTVTVAVGDGTSTITATVAEAATSGSSTTNNFDLDVSAEDLTVLLSSTGGTAAGCCTIHITYHDIEAL